MTLLLEGEDPRDIDTATALRRIGEFYLITWKRSGLLNRIAYRRLKAGKT